MIDASRSAAGRQPGRRGQRAAGADHGRRHRR